MSIIRPDLNLVIELYGSALPDFVFILKKIESEHKWIKFTHRLYELMARLKCDNYPELYQDENRIVTALLRTQFENDDKISEFIKSQTAKSLEEQIAELNDFFHESTEFSQVIEENMPHLDELDWSEAGQAKAKQEWAKLTPEEQKQAQRLWQYGLMFVLASFYNYFAVMVHGRKLTQLVAEAMAGNDESYYRAIHIDKSILSRIPYFKERHQRALETGEQDFLEAVGRWHAKPQLISKVRHPLLYMLFALLDGCQWLDDLKNREILDLCDELGLDRYENRIETENALTKRLIEYRKLQKSS
jgi:hypothetical protein